MIEETEPQGGWKFLRYIDGALWSEVGSQQWERFGKFYSVTGRIKFCRNGFGCSPSIAQALAYVWGEAVAEVDGRGTSDYEADRCVHREMRVNRAWRWTERETADLFIFAADEIIDVLSESRQTKPLCNAVRRGRDRIGNGRFAVPSHAHPAVDTASGCANAALRLSPVHNPGLKAGAADYELHQSPYCYVTSWYGAYLACAGMPDVYHFAIETAIALVSTPVSDQSYLLGAIGAEANRLVTRCPEIELETMTESTVTH